MLELDTAVGWAVGAAKGDAEEDDEELEVEWTRTGWGVGGCDDEDATLGVELCKHGT